MQVNRSKRTLPTVEVVCRVFLLAGTQAAVATVLRWLTTPALRQLRAALASGQTPRGGWTLELVVIDAAACVVWIAFAVLVIATALTLMLAWVPPTTSRAARIDRLGVPLWWRRAVLCACGLGLTAPVAAGPSLASDGHPDSTCPAGCSAERSAASVLSGLRLPDLPASAPMRGTGDRALIVRPGDSLWLIARASLHPSSSDSVVARRVHALYAANRITIGADPDLIFPGTELTNPGGHS